MQTRELFSLWRGSFEEIAVHGEVVVCDRDGVRYQTGESPGSFPARSLLKPIQFLVAGIPADRWENGGELRYTPCVGSLSATEEQTARLREWYGAPSLARLAAHNRVPACFPMDERHRVSLKSRGLGPERIFHTCFSKHMGILEGCERQGWDLASYASEEHPYHQALQTRLQAMLEETRSFAWVTDGCGLPSPVLTTAQMARLYQDLAEAPADDPLGKVCRRMLDQPRWVGGPGRVDTLLMEVNPGRVVAKEGADGLLAMGVLPSPSCPSGLGIVVKLAAGYYPPLAALALAPILEKLGLKGAHQVPKGQELRHQLPGLERLG